VVPQFLQMFDGDRTCTELLSRCRAVGSARPVTGTGRAFLLGMTSLPSGQRKRHRTGLPRGLRSFLLLLGFGILPGVVQAQMRSGVASVSLSAYAAPGVRWPGAGREAGRVAVGSTAALTGMTVNTDYRIERRVAGKSRVVLLSHGVAGVVPWDRIRAALEVSPAEPVLIDLVVTPAL
jgi:hypothetical protein